ncbi:Major allergen alt [Lasiodiplodia theobromae]|uniref:Major allergen alt n=1 Tax=Lasiodiplodia theobromae TaxID=45133 RepID=UPI0015C2F62C|nr:Major allergen alt [Lasiodiplodia theobromae]KAF4538178.1 Major allergen alt [Lasiodiplodia theobromae]
MKFFVAAAFLASSVSAIRTIVVTDTTIRDNEGLQSVSFTALGVKCSASGNALGSRQIACPGLDYAWHASGSNSEYTLTFFDGVNTDAAQASGKVPINCRAGGNGVNDKVCTQTGQFSVAL